MSGWRPWVGLGLLGLCGCDGGPQRVLGPEGPAARELAQLWWVLLAATAIPAALTILLFLLALLRARRASQQVRAPTEGENAILLTGGAVSGLVVIVLLVFTFQTGRATAEPPGPPAATVHVIGHQFWWEVRYPEHQVVDANELYIPAGQPVRLVVESGDVIHSFWVPQLHGKIDMIPGRTHHFWFQADRPGLFRGQCAEFCGIQHALMAFYVEAEPSEAFAARMARMRESSRRRTPRGDTLGERVFVEAGCALCHVVGDEPPRPSESAGPDLTHLARRRTLAAGTLPNTREMLRLWILNPQAIKPGVRMPPSPLPPEQMEALLDYLETLD